MVAENRCSKAGAARARTSTGRSRREKRMSFSPFVSCWTSASGEALAGCFREGGKRYAYDLRLGVGKPRRVFDERHETRIGEERFELLVLVHALEIAEAAL